jgi:hypothetical protein
VAGAPAAAAAVLGINKTLTPGVATRPLPSRSLSPRALTLGFPMYLSTLSDGIT